MSWDASHLKECADDRYSDEELSELSFSDTGVLVCVKHSQAAS